MEHRLAGNGLTLHQGRFRLDIRKNLFTDRVVMHWNRLPRAVVESPSLEVLKRCANVAVWNMVYPSSWQCLQFTVYSWTQ